MRRILITNFVRKVAADYAKDISTFGAIDKLEKLKATISSQPYSGDYVRYIQYIIDNYQTIITALPTDFDSSNPRKKLNLPKTFNLSRKFTVIRKDKNNNPKPVDVLFHKLIVESLGYDWVRNHSYPKFIAKIGIRTCVYCNAQYGVSIEKADGSNEITSSYQIDHYRPKSEYPYLATSFFNLQPSCSHCNQMKSKNDALFNLYTDKRGELSPFRFRLDIGSIVKFLLTCNSSDLEILLEVKNKKDIKLLENHEDRFHLTLKYENHKEEASDIVLMSIFYSKAYLRQLQTQFGNILHCLNSRALNVLLGFPTDENDIHKRPLTLLRQNLAQQLELLSL